MSAYERVHVDAPPAATVSALREAIRTHGLTEYAVVDHGHDMAQAGAQIDEDIAFGELGQADQIQPGDFLTVYREGFEPGQGYQVLGEVGILTTNTHTATGKIVAMRYSMKIGDHVEIR